MDTISHGKTMIKKNMKINSHATFNIYKAIEMEWNDQYNWTVSKEGYYL